jgi:hypothetical protein
MPHLPFLTCLETLQARSPIMTVGLHGPAGQHRSQKATTRSYTTIKKLAGQRRPCRRTRSWTSLPPSSCDSTALLDLGADSDIPLKQTRKKSSKSSSGRNSRKRQHNQEYNTLLPEVPEWDVLWQEGVQLDVLGSLDEGYDGQGFEASAEAFSNPTRASWGEEQPGEPALTDSEAEWQQLY